MYTVNNEHEALVAELTEALNMLQHVGKYTSPTVCSRDDTALLSYGFKFGSMGSGSMYKTCADGSAWRVVFVDTANGLGRFYKNDSEVGYMDYDTMVSTFR